MLSIFLCTTIIFLNLLFQVSSLIQFQLVSKYNSQIFNKEQFFVLGGTGEMGVSHLNSDTN